MFEQALAVEYGRTNRAWTTIAGMAGQALAVAGAMVLPMVAPQALPPPQELVRIFLPGAPVGPAPSEPAPSRAAPATRTNLQLRGNTLQEPRSMPAKAALIDEPPLTPAELGGGGSGCTNGCVPGGIPDGIPGGLPLPLVPAVPPPVPVAPVKQPAQATPPKAEPIPVGGKVQEALLINKVIPLYPPLARQARISGTVELKAVVGTDGRIRQLQVVGGHPFLVQAALEAVRQWVYRPTHLNGVPVEVLAPITVYFRLN